MNVVSLAQSQFAITTVYHFFFVPLTLGLSLIVAIMETLYVTKGDEIYKQMTKFWGKLFLINFAVGVVTGLVMEFQFGIFLELPWRLRDCRPSFSKPLSLVSGCSDGTSCRKHCMQRLSGLRLLVPQYPLFGF
jgi:hypothetical protein